MKISSSESKISNPAFLFLIVGVLFIIICSPWQGTNYNSLLSWDKAGYYLYLPITFIYKDWLNFKFIPEYLNQYQPANYWYETILLPNGNHVLSYPMGVALIQLPFFFIGYLGALLFGYKLDGFSEPFVFAVYLSGLMFTLIGIFYSYKSLCYYFSAKFSYITIVLFVIGTNLLFYGFIDTVMPHTYLFGLFSILIYNTIRWHKAPQFINLFVICFSIGLMVSIRATEILAAIIPVFWGVSNIESIQSKFRILFQNKLQLLICIIFAALPFLLQMIYWKYTTGHYIFNSYAYKNFGFSWLKPHLFNFLLSFRKGLFLYTPLLLVVILGFVLTVRKPKYRDFAFGFILFSVVNLYVISSWDVWWYGGSYGQRAMVQSYALYLFPFALVLEWISTKARILALLTYSFAVVCIVMNISFTWQYANGLICSDGITKGMYKEALLDPSSGYINEKDSIFEGAWNNSEVQSMSLLYSHPINDIAARDSSDGIKVTPGAFVELTNLNTDSIFKAPYKWVRCTFEMKHQDTNPLHLNNLVLIATTEGYEGDTRHWVGKSFNYLFKEQKDFNVWKTCVADFEIPAVFRTCDSFKFCFWMSGDETAMIKDIKLYDLKLKE